MGDICDTTLDFIEKYNPAPIGFVSVDVDAYTPTKAILKMLSSATDDRILPRIQMYFDDIESRFEFQGEWEAVKEFNTSSEHMKIAPEGRGTEAWIYAQVEKSNVSPVQKVHLINGYERMKIFHRFNHCEYNTTNDRMAVSFPLVNNLV